MLFGKHINRYYLRYAPALLLGIIALFAVDFFSLRIPEYYRMMINGMNTGFVDFGGESVPFDTDFLVNRVCMPFIGIILAMVAGRFLWRICFLGAGVRVETNLRDRMFGVSKTLSQQYYQRNKVGNLMSLYTNDIETVQDCFSSGILMLFDTILLGTLALWKMFRMNPYLTLLSLIPAGLLLAVGMVVGRAMERKWDERQRAFSALSDFSQECFSGIAVIKAFVKETRELMAFRKLNKENEDANVAFTKASTLLNVLVSLFVESIVCVILGYGGYLVYNGTFNAGELLEFYGYFVSIVWPCMAISQLIDMSSRGKASLARISELLDSVPDVRDREDVTPLTGDFSADIEFRDLTFRYPEAEYDALSHVSVRIKAGERVGIIGKTGSGKTTFVDLITRTYNVPDGTLFIDGRDVNTVPISDLRRHIAYVPQDNFLYSDTIENNINFFSGATHDDVVHAAVMSDVDGNISEFPEGYGTVLGERGVTVSGGQKQRISIARAIVREADILILDDSVSAVDSSTEKTILANLAGERAGKTTLLIAHRVSTVEQMDKVLLVDDGHVIGYAPHDELEATCPEYRKMVELQKLEETEGGMINA